MLALGDGQHSAAHSGDRRVHDTLALRRCLILARTYFSQSYAGHWNSSSRFFAVLPIDSTHWDLVYLLIGREVGLRADFGWIVDQPAHLKSIN